MTLFFPSAAYVRTGDESLPHVLAEERKLNIERGNEAAALVEALRAGPTSHEALSVFRPDWQVNSVATSAGTATVDFRRQGLGGGSLEEVLLVEALVRTLTALPEVEQVQFTVDGQVVESLMGHVSVEGPLSAADLRH